MKPPRAEQVFVLRYSVVLWVSHSLSFMCGISHDETSASINFHTLLLMISCNNCFGFSHLGTCCCCVHYVCTFCAKLYGQMNLCIITNCNETRSSFGVFHKPRRHEGGEGGSAKCLCLSMWGEGGVG